jgi:chemotaxis protein methyltransferase CheR
MNTGGGIQQIPVAKPPVRRKHPKNRNAGHKDTACSPEPSDGRLHIQPSFEHLWKLYESERYEEIAGITETSGNDSKMNKLLVRVYTNLGEFRKAGKLCLNIISQDTCDPEAYYLLGIIQRENGEIEDAIKTMNKAIYLDPDYILAQYVLARTLMSSGNRVRALKHLQNAENLLTEKAEGFMVSEYDGLTRERLLQIIQSVTAHMLEHEKE